MNCWTTCCTGGQELSKEGAFVPSGEEDDDNDNEDELSNSSRRRAAAAKQKQRIRQVENQILYTSSTKAQHRRSERRLTIFNSPIDMAEMEECVINLKEHANAHPKTTEQFEFLQAVLQENFIFTDFTPEERALFIGALQFEKVKPWTRSRSRSWFKSSIFSPSSASSSLASTTSSITTATDKNEATIIRQGDVGDYFYIVQKGYVEFEQDGAVVGSCTAGGVFGELALLYDCPRAASCIAVSDPSRENTNTRPARRPHAQSSTNGNTCTTGDDEDDDDDGHCHLWKVDQLTFRHLLARQANTRDKDMRGLLQSIPIFNDLDCATMTRFANAMMTVPFKAGDRIVQKGQTGNVFYIIEQGQVRIHDIGLGDSNNKPHDQMLGPGDWFGERALLTGEVRAANASAVSDTVTLAIDRETFEATIGPLGDFVDAEMQKHFLQAIPLFAKNIDREGCITEPEFQQLVKLMTKKCYEKGERLATIGEMRENNLWIIQTGRLLVTSHRPHQRCSMNSDTRRSLNQTHDAEKERRSSSDSPFKSSAEPKELTGTSAGKKSMTRTWTLKSGDYFFGDEETLKEGIVSSSAAVAATKTAPFRSVAARQKCLSTVDAVCDEALTTWVLTFADIECVLGDLHRLAGFLASKDQRAVPPPSSRLIKSSSGRYMPPRKSSERQLGQQIPLASLKKHRVLGHGAFGKVWLVSRGHIGNGVDCVDEKVEEDTFALKVMSKHKLLKSRQQQSVLRERELLGMLQHPFILQLVASYQDENNLYLLLPLIHGGELFKVLHKQKGWSHGLSNAKAAFYSACVIEALGHFHQRYIAYRDLKLENILIDKDGYCKVCDLGFSKIVVEKTYTLVGTPEYLAPELIMSKGHDMAVDYWAFGILCYELHMGVSPFYKSGSSQVDMFKRIVVGKFKPPKHTSPACCELIQGLLTRNPMKRLGNMSRGYLDIKNHAWYKESGINFTELLRKEFEPPWKPVVKNPYELADFDNFKALEKESSKGMKPLSKKEQEIFAQFG